MLKVNWSRRGLVLAIGAILLLAGCTPRRTVSVEPKAQNTPESITLSYYRWQDDAKSFDDIIRTYTALHPNIRIVVRKIDPSYYKPRIDSQYDYQEYIIQQIADGSGPDIFSLRNDWLPKLHQQIFPAPTDIINVTDFKQKFAQVATDDFVMGDKVYAIPFSIDNLILFYNPTLLAQGGFSQPPKTWDELRQMIPSLTKFEKGLLTKSAIALGADQESIPQFADILATLVMQYRGKMTSADHTKATFDAANPTVSSLYPGVEATDLYTSFARQGTPNYTYTDEKYAWGSRKFPSDVQAFGEGKTAMTIHYGSTVTSIEKFYPMFNFNTAPLPQVRVDAPVVTAKYWGETVSKASQHPDESWDFINFVAQEENLAKFYATTKHIPSLKSMWSRYRQDQYYGPVAQQAGFGKSWYRNDTEKIENVLANMVNNINRFAMEPKIAVASAARDITAILQD